jgi:hypothetical protein
MSRSQIYNELLILVHFPNSLSNVISNYAQILPNLNIDDFNTLRIVAQYKHGIREGSSYLVDPRVFIIIRHSPDDEIFKSLKQSVQEQIGVFSWGVCLHYCVNYDRNDIFDYIRLTSEEYHLLLNKINYLLQLDLFYGFINVNHIRIMIGRSFKLSTNPNILFESSRHNITFIDLKTTVNCNFSWENLIEVLQEDGISIKFSKMQFEYDYSLRKFTISLIVN